MTTYLKHTKRILQGLKPILTSRYHVDTIGLFGSIVRDDFVSDTSDVDIAVSFFGAYWIGFTVGVGFLAF